MKTRTYIMTQLAAAAISYGRETDFNVIEILTNRILCYCDDDGEASVGDGILRIETKQKDGEA